MKVPFQDLHAQYLSIKEEIDNSIAQVLETSAFVRGPFVEKFEQEFSDMLGVKHCTSCANGTDAIFLCLKALNIQPGDEVIVPAHSWISTSEVVSMAGGTVIFCDTEIDTFNIDTSQIESKITSRTVGIIPVHLYGQACNISEVMKIAKNHNLWVIEDCAQAILAEHKTHKVGTFGDMATFSFYPGKNLGAMGDAGCIITNDTSLANRSAMFARHGGLTKGQHLIEGMNSRLDGMQAAILLVKMKYIEEWTNKRIKIAHSYIQNLKNESISVPLSIDSKNENNKHVWHLFVIKSGDRDKLKSYLSQNGVSSVINYPIALPFLKAYDYKSHVHDDFPNAFTNQSRILSLPIFPEMKDEQLQYVCELINHYT